MSRKIMISCAVTGSADSPSKNPAVPVTPQAIATSAIDAAKAGAAIVHVHVRNPKTTRPSMDLALYREVTERIRESGVDVIINLTTGAGGRFAPGEVNPREGGVGTTLSLPHERTRHVEALRPEICSLDMGSMNMGDQAFLNTPGHLRAMAKTIGEAGVMPELEVFEAGHVLLARRLIDEGLIRSPALFQICLGILWSQPANAEAMLYMRNLLPADSVWFAFGISLHQFPMAAQAILLGGHVRVGLEDNLYLARGKLAPSNAVLVEKAAAMINLLDHSPATPNEAREMLNIGKSSLGGNHGG